MKTATFIKDLDGFTGEAKLYHISPPMTWDAYEGKKLKKHKTSFIAVSATIATFSGPETYVFPADKSGKVLNWGELDGSYRGGMDHEKAVTGAGYSIK